MTKSETASILTIFKVAYPYMYKDMRKEDAEMILNLWADMFKEEPVGIVTIAVKDVIATHSGYPPDISDVKKKIKEMTDAISDQPTDEELWRMVVNATSNGIYGAKEEYDKLPYILQKHLRNPSVLREYAMMDSETLNTVAKGQFLKTIKSTRAKAEYNERLPEAEKKYLKSMAERMAIPGGHEMDEIEFRTAQNKLLRSLE